jgi:hypothetical protein
MSLHIAFRPYTFHKNTEKAICVRTRQLRTRDIHEKKLLKALALAVQKTFCISSVAISTVSIKHTSESVLP